MGGFCFFRGSGNKTAKAIGIAMMATGVLILLLSVPSWLWASLLGILLTGAGFLIWRFA